MELGRIQRMRIARIEGQGAYLEDDSGEPAVLLPRKEVPEDAIPGVELDVFLYKDSEDRLITTVNPPPMEVGGMALLEVAQINPVGAFLDWGLAKDLFLPYQEQRGRIEEGKKVLVALYIDQSERLCGTMRVYDFLSADSPYKKDDVVKGTVYQVTDELGALVAVDNRYFGLVPAKEIFRPVQEGEVVEARVTRVCEDGKLDLSLRKKAFAAMGDDAEKVAAVIEEYGGRLPFTDKASPERIRDEFQMSKNEFKRAVGRLLKEQRIRIEEDGIVLCGKPEDAGKAAGKSAEAKGGKVGGKAGKVSGKDAAGKVGGKNAAGKSGQNAASGKKDSDSYKAALRKAKRERFRAEALAKRAAEKASADSKEQSDKNK